MRTLEITVKIGCKNKCSYCPQSTLVKAYSGDKMLSFGGFVKVLRNTPKDVRVDFSGFCEPFLNPDASKMMRYSIESGYRTVLYTTLVGFERYDAEMLRRLKFEEVVFHVFDGIGFDSGVFNKKVALFRESVHDGRVAKIDPSILMSRGGNLFKTERREGKFVCAVAGDGFSCNVVLPNGDVYLCCSDYGLKHKIGNLYVTFYDELNRDGIKKLSLQEDSECICRYCERFVKI